MTDLNEPIETAEKAPRAKTPRPKTLVPSRAAMAARRASAICRRPSCSNSPSCCSSPIAISPAIPTRILKDFGFGRAHHRVLHFVNRHSGLRVADLLDILTITKQSLSRVLKQLIDKGYIVQQAGASDRRERLLFPTDKGRALAERLAAPQSVRLAEALKAAGPGAEAVLRRFLEAMVNAEERPKVSTIMAATPVPLKEGGKGEGS